METSAPADWTRLLETADQLTKAGRLDDAADATRRALDLQERGLSGNDPLIGTSLLKLGALQIRTQKYGEADESLTRARSIFTTAFGAESVQVSDVLVNLAALQLRRGSTDGVEDYYRQALNIREKAYGANDLRRARTAFDLAEFYQGIRKFSLAQPLYERALAARAAALPQQDTTLKVTMARFACMLRKDKQEAAALALEQRAAIGPWPEAPVQPDEKKTKREHRVNDAAKSKLVRLESPIVISGARNAAPADEILVNVLVDPTGQVLSACADSGSSAYWGVSEFAALRSRFSPNVVDGVPGFLVASIWYEIPARSSRPFPSTGNGRSPVTPNLPNPFIPDPPPAPARRSLSSGAKVTRGSAWDNRYY